MDDTRDTGLRIRVLAACLLTCAACAEEDGPEPIEGDAGQQQGPDAAEAGAQDDAGPAAEGDRLEAFCQADAAEVTARVAELMASLSLEQRVSLLSGTSVLPIEGTWQAGAVPDEGIAGFRMLDGPKGVGGSSTLTLAGGATTTAFPVAMARSATWNRELERRVGQAMARELLAVGGNTLLAPGMNLAWHPLSGRNQEYYGEDPFLAGEMGTSFVLGVQGEGVLATAKHYAINNIEDTRLEVDAVVDGATLRESFLPQFRKVVQQGQVGAIMSAYNRVNGTYCGENGPLLNDILKDDWGFAGIVMSDFLWGTHDTVNSALGGLDLEMPVAVVYGDDLLAQVNAGNVSEDVINDHASRILRTQLCFGFTDPAPDPSQLETEPTLELAREVARHAVVLLKNEGSVLPLAGDAAESLVLTGPQAELENIGDAGGSSGVKTSDIVSVAEALRARTDLARPVSVVGSDLQDSATRDALEAAGVVVAVVGLSEEDEGEGQVGPPAPVLGAGDRERFGLSEEQEAFLAELFTLQSNVVVVVQGGSAIDMSPWLQQASAVLMVWYGGSMGGHGVMDVLLGDHSPSGRMPVAVPASLDDLQAFPFDSLRVEYERLHGQQRLDANGVAPLFPLGFGLSYSAFAYSELSGALSEDGAAVELSFSLQNTGARSAVETPQVYAGLPSTEGGPLRKLVGFEQLSLDAGESAEVDIRVPLQELARYTDAAGWQSASGMHRFFVGPNAAEFPLEVELDL